jgi:hypothetical protein
MSNLVNPYCQTNKHIAQKQKLHHMFFLILYLAEEGCAAYLLRICILNKSSVFVIGWYENYIPARCWMLFCVVSLSFFFSPLISVP